MEHNARTFTNVPLLIEEKDINWKSDSSSKRAISQEP